jgi:AraC family transcriptional regulator
MSFAPRIGLEFELRKTVVGHYRHAASADHHVTVHAGGPVRISCMPSGHRCVRRINEIDVFPAGLSEDWFEDDASEHLRLRLPTSLVRVAAEEMGLDPDRASIAPRCQFRDVQIEHIAWALAEEDRATSPHGLLYRESLGMALAVHLLARYPAQASEVRAGLSAQALARITEYIEAHLTEDVSLLRLARVCGMSASHLRVLFKRTVGIPIHEYVIQRRVERARVLLVESELPVSQIALEAGFAHQSHMARCMRKRLGFTPNSVRAANRASAQPD